MNPSYSQSRSVAIWLLICALTVYAMFVVGAVTRLTQSGLSMVEWEPIMGIIPPLNLAEWQETFAKYKASPEYIKINAGMSLEAFKSIFYWEYGHRVLGRVLGMLFFIPFMVFLVRGYFTTAWKLKLFGLLLLGGTQGFVGWFMVQSGLIDNPHVSQYRLAMHFGIALLIYTIMVWFMLDFFTRAQSRQKFSFQKWAKLSVALVFLMMITGAFVAGLKAGHIYNTFPYMGDSLVPEGLWSMSPAWMNIFENPVTVQFIHRCLAVVVFLSLMTLVVKGVKLKRLRPEIQIGRNLVAVLVLLLCQVAIGIITLLVIKEHPVLWPAFHQFTGVALLTSIIFLAHKVSKEY